ncbi:TolC family protein [Sphingomonas sp. PL-96]|uniref:efflux transporter outer membrane subunit n=1 Tax=Sphingomonas sp. PL-96 TaxID=2887201 RepID=UPI001E2F2D20|nr:TolC family protein [Sphingomonas sp. PL-96]MCC2977107.1 TolC family protein [Sphingomonas sp. PL-96]
MNFRRLVRIAGRPAAWACGSALLLAGCVHAPDVRTPTTAVPVAYDGQNGGLPAIAIDRWWTLYGDPQLASLVDHALANGFSVREAFARLDEARATRSGALARFGLQGNLEANAQVQRSKVLTIDEIPGFPDELLTNLFAPTTTRTTNASLPISWQLDLFGRRGANRRVADATLAAARFTYEGARATLAADVARSLFEARGLAAQLEDARATAANQRRLNEVVAGRVRRGLDPSTQSEQVEGSVAQAAAEVSNLEGAFDAARRALLILIGSGPSPLASLPVVSALPEVPSIPATMPGELLVRRPDVREARAQLDAASGNVRVAELAFYPTITLQAALAYASQTGGIGTTTLTGTGAGGLTAPIFDRGRLKAELRTASARAEQAVLAYERLVQNAYGEADQALIRLDADRRRITALEAGVARSQRGYDAALKRLQLGFADLQEVLEAERNLRSARSGLTAARVEGLTRSVQAFQALGGGWTATPDTKNPKDRP